MEKSGYREQLELLKELFPGKVAISVRQAAQVLGCDVHTAYSSVNRSKDPLPTKKIGGKLVVPISLFANWLV